MFAIVETPINAHCGNSNCNCGDSCKCEAGNCKCGSK